VAWFCSVVARTVGIQVYSRRAFAAEDGIGMSNYVLYNKNVVSVLKIVVSLLFLRPFGSICFLCKQEDEVSAFFDVHTHSFTFAPMQW